MSVTLKQISEETGISISTISRVTTGCGYVAEETRQIVEDAIQRLNYSRRKPLPQVRRGNDDVVMILVGGIRSSLAAHIVEELVQELDKKQKRAFMAITNFSPERERSFLKFAEDNHFFGIISMTITETPETLSMLRNFSCPMVMVERYLPSMDSDCLRSDCYRMGFLGAEYLIENGHRKIGFIGGSRDSTITQDKKTGFMDCMQASGLELRPEWIIHVDRLIYANGIAVANQLLALEERPTALVSSNDISVSILNELISHGVRVPEDISICNCEDSQMVTHCQVPLTSMSVDFARMAVDAVKTLCRRRRQPSMPRSQLIYNPQLIERSSVQNLRAEKE
ncbi:MAG: LacI family DNA-binding transcriptional regulator [Clostridia bacterium]|nr:LacI family DNA-binding transcriptional regulator [Clostridia bacterium]